MARKHNNRVRLEVEALEAREVMSVFGTADWSTISSASSGRHPYRMAVSIYAKNSDGSIGRKVGSGAMIARNVVLTAGHVVYDEANNRFENGLVVVPGQAEGYKPYGMANSVQLKSVVGYTQNREAWYDVGVIYLDRNLGSHTGWFGLKNKAESYFDNKGFVNILHYPSDTMTGRQLVYSSGNSSNGTPDFIRYAGALDTEHGSSGAPVYTIENGSRYIVGVHHQGAGGNHPNHNQAVRIDNFWFKRIVDWKDDRALPTDRADLMNRDTWFNVSQSSMSSSYVSRGGYLSTTAKVWNGGTKAAGSFTVKFYASTNSTISTSDVYLGSVNVSTLSAFQTVNVTLSGYLPSSVSGGSYRIGWIIDSGAAVSEFAENNNTGYVQSWLYVGSSYESANEEAAAPQSSSLTTLALQQLSEEASAPARGPQHASRHAAPARQALTAVLARLHRDDARSTPRAPAHLPAAALDGLFTQLRQAPWAQALVG